MGIEERKQREKERRRRRILNAARRLFLEKGYGPTSIAQIAKEAELSPGTVYAYFRCKEEMLFSLGKNSISYLSVRLKHHTRSSGLDIKERISAVKTAFLETIDYDADIAGYLPVIFSRAFWATAPDCIQKQVLDLWGDLCDSVTTLLTRGNGGSCHELIAQVLLSIFLGANVVFPRRSSGACRNVAGRTRDNVEAGFLLIQRGIAEQCPG